ncbi:hypothetical protein NDU88_004740 [Pleurodeles waltl]|uniref:Uncharacterized protein n=1 Tax=Pleurodeles waltl TaxID=8319 RepID=A0AAV7TAH6_PLEWA|nr:hypothetical protein NDU88_004740 [Pleurodeles waltl]
MPPQGRHGRRARSENKPTKAQSAEERTHLLCKATQFISNPYLALNELADAEADRADSSDAGDSRQGPLLTRALQMTFDPHVPCHHSLHGKNP